MTEASPRHLADRLADLARPADPPGQITKVAGRTLKLLGPLLQLAYRPQLEGLEHLPPGPCLVVSNHSGCGQAECACLLWCWWRRFGAARPIAGMAAPSVFLVPGAGWVLRGVGAVPATYRHAMEAFAQGASVIVFPGGDHEAFRPVWQANRVDFNGRRGYLRLARQAGVPIVPLGIRGSHYTAPVLWRTKLLAYLLVYPRFLLAVKRIPITLLGVIGAVLILWFAGPAWGYLKAGALAVGWAFGPFAMIPFVPWTVRARLGPALSPEELFGEGDAERSLDAANERVLAEVRRLVCERC